MTFPFRPGRMIRLMNASMAQNRIRPSAATRLKSAREIIGRGMLRFFSVPRWLWAMAFPAKMLDPSTIDSLYRLAHLITENETRAERLVINAYLNVAKSVSFNGNDPSLRMLLFAAVHRSFRQEALSEEGKSFARRSTNSTVYDRARTLIYSQTPDLRFLIFLRHCENFSCSQIAEITGMPVHSIRRQLLRFRNCAATLCLSPQHHSAVC